MYKSTNGCDNLLYCDWRNKNKQSIVYYAIRLQKMAFAIYPCRVSFVYKAVKNLIKEMVLN